MLVVCSLGASLSRSLSMTVFLCAEVASKSKDYIRDEIGMNSLNVFSFNWSRQSYVLRFWRS